MKFKSFIDSDIEDFRKLNISIVEKSRDDLVCKIEKKYGIKNEAIGIIDEINRLLGKKTKVGFTLETGNIEKKVKLSKKKTEAIKIKLFESNNSLAEMKRDLERKLLEKSTLL